MGGDLNPSISITIRKGQIFKTIKESKWERKFETVDVLNKKEKQQGERLSS